MVMRWIIQEWVAQWLGLRDRLGHAEGEPDRWWLGIRERILRFLLTRYIEEEDRGSGEPPPLPTRPPLLPVEYRRTFCRVKAEEHPPRKCADMSARLRSVHTINTNKRIRWRWL